MSVPVPAPGTPPFPPRRGAPPVVASDLTPELFVAGRRIAAARGVEMERVEADAKGLPFADESFSRTVVMDHCADPTEFREYWKRTYGPTIAVYKYNAADPERIAELDRDFLRLLTTWTRGGTYEAEYLLVTARRR
jgi:hypothetical protein